MHCEFPRARDYYYNKRYGYTNIYFVTNELITTPCDDQALGPLEGLLDGVGLGVCGQAGRVVGQPGRRESERRQTRRRNR